MILARHVRWRHAGWSGVIDLAAGLSPGQVLGALDPGGRRSRHAWTRKLDGALTGLWLKVYPAPDGRRAWRAWRMGNALEGAGFDVPDAVLVGRRAGEGVLVTREVGGRPVVDAVAAAGGDAKRELLCGLGRAVGALHAAGFVHGDLVPTNVHVRDGAVVFLDHDRTRRGRLLVWWGARRNLVQLGRVVVPGVSATDRARVLWAYGARRGLSRRARRRLARWVAAKTIARRVAIDRLPADQAQRAGYAAVMRSGGPYDSTDAAVQGRGT
jgi:hypothetical protein